VHLSRFAREPAHPSKAENDHNGRASTSLAGARIGGTDGGA
jgi:hypothetical protein